MTSFFGIKHRRRREEMEEQVQQRQRRRCAAEAARITDEKAGSEECKHMSGGSLCGNRR